MGAVKLKIIMCKDKFYDVADKLYDMFCWCIKISYGHAFPIFVGFWSIGMSKDVITRNESFGNLSICCRICKT